MPGCTDRQVPRSSNTTVQTFMGSIGSHWIAMVDPAVLVREGIFAAGIVALFLLVGLAVLVVCTASLPVCQKCGFRSVRRTHSHQSGADSFARACFLHPYRCEKCLRRFYCFGARRVSGRSGSMSMARRYYSFAQIANHVGVGNNDALRSRKARTACNHHPSDFAESKAAGCRGIDSAHDRAMSDQPKLSASTQRTIRLDVIDRTTQSD